MRYTILDCYTDEASGLGVPPYLGTYPGYLYGKLVLEGQTVKYLTIDDLRLWKQYGGVKKEITVKEKTNISIYNLTINDAAKVLAQTDVLIVILGVQVPGKYLTAIPGTLREVVPLLSGLKMKKILTGPALSGTQLEGGRWAEKIDLKFFDEVNEYNFDFKELQAYALKGVELLNQIPDQRVIEIETGRGCQYGKCSFCTEPLKNKFCNRSNKDILLEIIEFYNHGARHFRLGKQADFYALDEPISLLKNIRENCPDLQVLHIDNVNPVSVVGKRGEEITQAIVKYCTAGNVAALGVESFDSEVVKANTLNCTPELAWKAIQVINKYGAECGSNGLPKFLPGINLLFGLIGESKRTHQENMNWLKKIIDEGLLLRRINIRQVAVFPGTRLEQEAGNKYLRKNNKYYWKWREEIRQKIDFPLLQRLVPIGTVLTEVYTEMYDGKTTFCRQYGTYPLIIGVHGRLPLKQKIKVRVVSHMLRSIVGEAVS